jgi:hypothetical protein
MHVVGRLSFFIRIVDYIYLHLGVNNFMTNVTFMFTFIYLIIVCIL